MDDHFLDDIRYAFEANYSNYPVNFDILSVNYYGLSPQRVYTYPDGTPCASRPKDGAKCVVSKPNSLLVDEWQWNHYKDSWIPTGNSYSYHAYYNAAAGYPGKIVPDPPTPLEVLEAGISAKASVKCECGSEKIGSQKHSSWCDKYSKA